MFSSSLALEMPQSLTSEDFRNQAIKDIVVYCSNCSPPNTWLNFSSLNSNISFKSRVYVQNEINKEKGTPMK